MLEIYVVMQNFCDFEIMIIWGALYSVSLLVIDFKMARMSQCGKFRISLSFRFYVKSTLENIEVLKVPFLPF